MTFKIKSKKLKEKNSFTVEKKKTKDWTVIFENDFMLRYKNNKNDNTLEIYPEKIRGKTPWFVAVTDEKSIRDKEFSTKSQALKFAKDYMKKHNKC